MANNYNQDGLTSAHNCDFMDNPKFKKAFDRGMKAHGKVLQIHWRVHVALWVADSMKRLEGDFVECGVNRGILSSSIMEYIHWNHLNKHFFLFDTFNGIDPKYLNEHEKNSGLMKMSNEYYPECFEHAKQNFMDFRNIHLIRGSVPETLTSVEIDKVCYLSLDMNCALPELAAAEYFWPKMVSGAMAILDDYTYQGYEEQHKAYDLFALRKNITILSLPTGQGIYIKP